MKFSSEKDVYQRMHWLDSEAGDDFQKVYNEILQSLSEDIKIPFQSIRCTEVFDDIKLTVIINNKEFSHTLRHFGSDYIDESIFSLVRRILQEIAPDYKLFHDPDVSQEIIWGVFTDEEVREIKSLKGITIEPYIENEIPQS